MAFMVYRFHGFAAINTPAVEGSPGATYYLSPSEARRVAEALQSFADAAERGDDWPDPVNIDADGTRR